MKKRGKMQPFAIVSVVLLVLASVVGGAFFILHNLSDEAKTAIGERWEKIVFNKTVDDFEGRLIDNLDEDPTTNFIVYTEGVKKISTENGVNQILSVDNESLTYYIGNPDEQITNLQKGDVFFIEPNEYYAYGLSVKVKSITQKDVGVEIQGDELQLKDIIEYADVDMDVPVTTFYLESSAGNSNGSNTDSYMADSGDVLVKWVDGDNTILSQSLNMQQSQVAPVFWKQEIPIGEWEMPGGEISTGLALDIAALHVEGNYGVRVSTIHCTFRVRPAFLTAIIGVEAPTNVFVGLEASANGTASAEIKAPSIIVPVAGPLVFNFTPSVSVDFEGSAGVSWEWSGDMESEFDIGYGPFTGLYTRTAVIDFHGNNPEWNLTEMKGSISLEVLKGNAKFGIPYVANIYNASRVGASAEGEIEFPSLNSTEQEDSESIHVCEMCVDGKLYLYKRMDVGVVLDFLNMVSKESKKGGMIDFDGEVSEDGETAEMTSKDGKIYDFGDSKSWRLLDLSWNVFNIKVDFPFVKDPNFYVSVRNGLKPEMGFGDCPYHNWRTEIKVVDMEQQPVSEAGITVISQDGVEIEQERTGEDGTVILFLPNGNNVIKAEKNGRADSENILINDAVASAALSLEEKRDLFVICDFYYLDYSNPEGYKRIPQPLSAYPTIITMLKEKYPEAQVYSKYDLANEAGTQYPNYSLEEVSYLGLSRGDIILELDFMESRGTYRTYVNNVGSDRYDMEYSEEGIFEGSIIGIDHIDVRATIMLDAYRDGTHGPGQYMIYRGYYNILDEIGFTKNYLSANDYNYYYYTEYVDRVYMDIIEDKPLEYTYCDDTFAYTGGGQYLNLYTRPAERIDFYNQRILAVDFYENYAQYGLYGAEYAVERVFPQIDFMLEGGHQMGEEPDEPPQLEMYNMENSENISGV